jgi:hypothetical protein
MASSVGHHTVGIDDASYHPYQHRSSDPTPVKKGCCGCNNRCCGPDGCCRSSCPLWACIIISIIALLAILFLLLYIFVWNKSEDPESSISSGVRGTFRLTSAALASIPLNSSGSCDTNWYQLGYQLDDDIRETSSLTGCNTQWYNSTWNESWSVPYVEPQLIINVRAIRPVPGIIGIIRLPLSDYRLPGTIQESWSFVYGLNTITLTLTGLYDTGYTHVSLSLSH